MGVTKISKSFDLNSVVNIIGAKFDSIMIKEKYMNIYVSSKDVSIVARYLRDSHSTSFTQLLDVTCVDYPKNDKRFEMNYSLLSMEWNQRILLKAGLKDKDYIQSVSGLYSSAGWLEREVWDMFGIYFVEHMDLRRILTDYGFDGFPLRKDFPLIGYVEVRYDSGFKYIRIEPVEIMQEMRVYSSNSPWVKN